MSWLTSDSANGGKQDMSNMVTLFNGSGKILPLYVQGPDGSTQELGAAIQPKAMFAIPQESCGLDPYATYIAKGSLVQVQAGQPVPIAPPVRGEYAGTVVTPRTADFAGGNSMDTPNMPVVSAYGQESMDYVPPPAGAPPAPLINQASVDQAAANLPPVAQPPVAQPPAVIVGAALVAAGQPGQPNVGSMIPQNPSGKGRRGRPPKAGSKAAKKAAAAAAAAVPAVAQPVAPQPPAAPVLAPPPMAQAAPQPVQANNVPINPLTGKPMWVQVGPMLPSNDSGYIIKPAPAGMPPGKALMIPIEALGEHSPEVRAALAQATDRLLHEATRGSEGSDMTTYDKLPMEQKEVYIQSLNDMTALNQVIMREPDGRLSLLAQQRSTQLYNASQVPQPVQPAVTQPVAPAVPMAPVPTVPMAPAVPVLVARPAAPVAVGQSVASTARPAAPVMVTPGGPRN